MINPNEFAAVKGELEEATRELYRLRSAVKEYAEAKKEWEAWVDDRTDDYARSMAINTRVENAVAALQQLAKEIE